MRAFGIKVTTDTIICACGNPFLKKCFIGHVIDIKLYDFGMVLLFSCVDWYGSITIGRNYYK